MALSANKNLLALFCDLKGRLIVLKSDLSKELSRKETHYGPPEKLIWCANDVTALVYEDKISKQSSR